MIPFRNWLLDEDEIAKPIPKPKKGVSRLFRCGLLDEEQEPRVHVSTPKQEQGAIGGIFTLEPIFPKKKKKKQRKEEVAAAPARTSLVSFLPAPSAEASPVEDLSPVIKRARRARELLILAAAGSWPYRR